MEDLNLSVLTDKQIRTVVNNTWTENPDTIKANGERFTGIDVFDRAPMAIAIGEKDGANHPLRYANRAFEEMTGYREEDILHRDFHFMQGEKTDPERIARISEALETGEPVTLELRNYRKNGSMFWNRLTVAPVRNARGKRRCRSSSRTADRLKKGRRSVSNSEQICS